MCDKMYEKVSDRGKENIAKETREAIKPVIRELTEKFDKMGFRREDVAPAIKRGIDDAKSDVG